MSTGIDIQFIRENYQKMTDAEILSIATKDISSLTDEAQEVIRKEMTVRNLVISNQTDTLIAEANPILKNKNNFEFALLFSLLFGPIGLLYASITYGIIMTVLAFIAFFTLSYWGLVIAWLICIALVFKLVDRSKYSAPSEIKSINTNDSLLN